MRKLLMGEAQCRTARARYYLLEEEPGEGEAVSYGIQVELEDETAAARGLSPSRQRTAELAEALVRGVVTPITLRDVVDDWLLA